MVAHRFAVILAALLVAPAAAAQVTVSATVNLMGIGHPIQAIPSGTDVSTGASIGGASFGVSRTSDLLVLEATSHVFGFTGYYALPVTALVDLAVVLRSVAPIRVRIEGDGAPRTEVVTSTGTPIHMRAAVSSGTGWVRYFSLTSTHRVVVTPVPNGVEYGSACGIGTTSCVSRGPRGAWRLGGREITARRAKRRVDR